MNALSDAIKATQPKNALLKRSAEEIAVVLLRASFVEGPETSVSQRNAINRITQQLGLGGRDRRTAARVLAEGWQCLANAGLICPDPEPTHGDWWFLTRRGSNAAQSDEALGELLSVRPS